jgi:hypothetical protein
MTRKNEFEFDKREFIVIEPSGNYPLLSRLENGKWITRANPNMYNHIRTLVPRDGKNFEMCASDRFYLFYKRENLLS